MEVSSRNVGRIIGRGGSKIRELQDESGAQIKVRSDEENSRGNVPVEIRGSEQARQLAKELIDELIESQRY
jgi:ATP-dependent RNA helicase DDX43